MISVAQSFSNSRNDLQDVTAVIRDLLACFVSQIVAQKQLVNCLAFSWVFQNDILRRSDKDEAGTARKTNDYATKTSCGLNLRFWCPAVLYSV